MHGDCGDNSDDDDDDDSGGSKGWRVESTRYSQRKSQLRIKLGMCCYINNLNKKFPPSDGSLAILEPRCRGNWSAMGGSRFGLTNGTLHCLISKVETDASLAT